MGTKKTIENLAHSLHQLKKVMRELGVGNVDPNINISEEDLKELSEKVTNLAESLENHFKPRSR